MIDLIAAATVGAIAGSAIMRRIDLRKIEEGEASADRQCEQFLRQLGATCRAESAHARLADACLAKQARIDRLKDIASSQKSVKSARIVAVLDGDA